MEESDAVPEQLSELEAIAVVQDFLDAWEPPRDDEWVVTEVRPSDWGWAIFWTNRRYAEGTRDKTDIYAADSPERDVLCPRNL
jgi:hypothetical protein